MVLPSPAADPGAAQAPGWLDRLIRPLELTRDGILLCLRDATPTQLGPVVRALSPSPPWAETGEALQVCLRATEVLDVSPGSRVLLRVRVEDLDWLNIARPLFAERKLRTVLWADAEAHEGLVRRAVDFYDWVSRTVAVPNKAVPDFAVERMRAAVERGAAVAWEGEGLLETLRIARAGPTIKLHAEQPYLQLIAALRAETVPIVSGVHSARDAWRLRIAMEEAEHRGLWIAISPGSPIAGLQLLHGRQVDWDEASARLRAAGLSRPALLAAWFDLEPERIEQAVATLRVPLPSAAFFGGILEGQDTVRDEVLCTIEAEIASTGDLIEALVADGEFDEARALADEWSHRAKASGTSSSPLASAWQQRLNALESPPSAAKVSRPVADDGDDWELLERWVAGDRAAGSALVEHHYGPLRAFVAARIPRVESEDLIQETFTRLIESAARRNREQSVRIHLLRIARKMHDELRRQLIGSTVPGAELVEDLDVDPLTIVAEREELQLLNEALRRIPREYREIIELYYFHNFSAAELGEILEKPESSVRSILVRARQSLRDAMQSLAEGRSEASLDLDSLVQLVKDRRPL